MGEDGRVTVDTAAGKSASEAALERYAVRLRRERIRYAAVIAVVVVIASVIATVVWLSGEISHTTLHTVAKAPADITLAPAAPTQQKAWSSTDQAAAGTPYAGGSVVTFDAHTVRGRNGITGAQTWSYTRTDRTVCTAMQVSGVTVAVYKLNGNCDELTALDSGTGKREWTRTLDMDTHQLNGVPQFSISGTSVMFVSPAVIYNINTSNGYNNWLFAESNCTISRAVLGSGGALISQTCERRGCSQLKHCLDGPQLVLRDPITGENTDSSKNNGNPDQITWNLPNPTGRVPASAGSIISSFTASGAALQIYDSKSGKIKKSLPLGAGNGASLQSSTATDVSDGELIWSGGSTYAVIGIPGAIMWTLTDDAAPTVTSDAFGVTPTLSLSRLAAPGTTGISELSTTTGQPEVTSAVSPVPSSTARVYPFGTGYVVADKTVTVYR
jgi:hypothetical protein